MKLTMELKIIKIFNFHVCFEMHRIALNEDVTDRIRFSSQTNET